MFHFILKALFFLVQRSGWLLIKSFTILVIVFGVILSGYFTTIDRFQKDPKTIPFSKSVYEKTRNKFIFS